MNKSLKIKNLFFIILLFFILLFFISTIRKMIIISKLSSKANTYEDSNNYHISLITCNNDKITKDDNFIMNDKIKSISIEIPNSNYNSIIENITFGNLLNTSAQLEYSTTDYITKNNSKIAIINGSLIGKPTPNNILKTNNIFELFKLAITTSITSTTYNNKKSYKITKLFDSNNSIYFIDCETGLIISSIDSNGTTQNYNYEFNTVNNDSFIEPNKSEYVIMTPSEYVNSNN